MTKTEQLIQAIADQQNAIESQSEQIKQLTVAISNMASVMADMVEELAAQNAPEQDPENSGFLDD